MKVELFVCQNQSNWKIKEKNQMNLKGNYRKKNKNQYITYFNGIEVFNLNCRQDLQSVKKFIPNRKS